MLIYVLVYIQRLRRYMLFEVKYLYIDHDIQVGSNQMGTGLTTSIHERFCANTMNTFLFRVRSFISHYDHGDQDMMSFS